MRKILASTVTVLLLGSMAGEVFAGGTNAPSGSSSSASFSSSHAGSVTPTCSLDVKDGVLPTGQEFVSSLITNIGQMGKISTVCNSTGSQLTVGLGIGSAPSQPNYTESFRLINGTGVYSGSGMATFGTTYTKVNLANNSATPSTLDIRARGGVPTTQFLAAGSYTIVVKVTVAP